MLTFLSGVYIGLVIGSYLALRNNDPSGGRFWAALHSPSIPIITLMWRRWEQT